MSLSRSAPVLLVAFVVACIAALVQIAPIAGWSHGDGPGGPVTALDQAIQDIVVRARAPGSRFDSGADVARDPRTFITIVAIDERTIAELGTYGGGYPRRLHAQVVNHLLADPPRTIVFDLGFFEPTPDDDLLAASFEQARSLPVPTSIVLGAVGLAPDERSDDRTANREPVFERMLAPVSLLASRADVALANILPDERGTIRSIPIVSQAAGGERPALGLAAVAAYLRRPATLDARTDSSVRFAGRVIPIETNAAVRIGYVGPPSQSYGQGSTFRVVSFVDILRGRLDPSIWRGGLVLVGPLGATGLADDYWTPTSDQGRKMAGVEIHANVAATLFSENFLRAAPSVLDVAIVFAVTASVALLTANLGALAGGLASVLVLGLCARQPVPGRCTASDSCCPLPRPPWVVWSPSAWSRRVASPSSSGRHSVRRPEPLTRRCTTH